MYPISIAFYKVIESKYTMTYIQHKINRNQTVKKPISNQTIKKKTISNQTVKKHIMRLKEVRWYYIFLSSMFCIFKYCVTEYTYI